MKEQYVRDLVEGARVDSVFALRSRDLRRARTGDSFLALQVGDATGVIPAVMFRPSSSDESVPAGSVVRLRGTVTTYRGVRRISVESLQPEAAFERRDLLASGTREIGDMVAELRVAVRKVRQPALRAILRGVFGDPGFVERFSACPAGATGHHAFVGGLLEHTLTVSGLCLSLSASYPQIDRDLLLTAALLHDVGVVEELTYDTAVGSTEAGRLVGHVVLGVRLISRVADALGTTVPAGVALRLSHAVLAHHGESGSHAPRSLEALVLQGADRLDSQVTAFLETAAGAAVLEERWTDEANAFGRALLVPGPAQTRELACA